MKKNAYFIEVKFEANFGLVIFFDIEPSFIPPTPPPQMK